MKLERTVSEQMKLPSRQRLQENDKGLLLNPGNLGVLFHFGGTAGDGVTLRWQSILQSQSASL